MAQTPVRRIARLAVTIRIPGAFDAQAREVLQKTAHTCPVHQSLSPSVEIPVAFEWDPLPVRA
jgi:putative redox protein